MNDGNSENNQDSLANSFGYALLGLLPGAGSMIGLHESEHLQTTETKSSLAIKLDGAKVPMSANASPPPSPPHI